MAIFSRQRKGPAEEQDAAVAHKGYDDGPVRLTSLRIISMALIVSLGGLIFGYDTGQISGFLEMQDFLDRFGEDGKFSTTRSGLIVALLSIGTLVGAIVGAPIADRFGRKIAIIFWNLIFIVGVIVQISSTYTWQQVAVGRLIAGFGVGGLSVLTPMYQSETAPRQIRGTLVSCYQLFITFGILLASIVNRGSSTLVGSPSSWRIGMGIGFLFPALMILGITFLPETPRYDYRHGRVERAKTTIAASYGVSENHWEVAREIKEIKAKLDAEQVGGKHPFYEVFTGPRMMYRILLGVTLQALQQLTGANYYFYYGTTIFNSVGLSNSFNTALILAAVNFIMTFPGLYIVEKVGRRKALIAGGLWQCMCFLVFASVGTTQLDQANPQSTPQPGRVMIAFACLFIAGYAMTWGPIIWAVIGELFPSRYRALAMGICTASNWVWNFLISYFTPLITAKIGFSYGFVFAGCNLAACGLCYFGLIESSGRSLEEIDTMYILHVPPRQSSKWEPPAEEDLVTADSLYLTPGARDIRKTNTGTADKLEDVPPPTSRGGIHDVSGSGYVPESTGARGDSIV